MRCLSLYQPSASKISTTSIMLTGRSKIDPKRATSASALCGGTRTDLGLVDGALAIDEEKSNDVRMIVAQSKTCGVGVGELSTGKRGKAACCESAKYSFFATAAKGKLKRTKNQPLSTPSSLSTIPQLRSA